MAYLSSIELDEGRGQRVGVFLKSNGAPTMMTYAWMDCDRRYFISTASWLQDGKDYSRIRWRQPDTPEEDFGGVNNEESEQQELTVSQPNVPKYNTTLVQQLTSIIAIGRILSRSKEKCRRNLGRNA